MVLLPFTVFLLCSCLHILTEANSMHSARMKFTAKGTKMKRIPLPENHAPVWIDPEGEPDTVIVAGQNHLMSFNFENPQKNVKKAAPWKGCTDSGQRDCNYIMTVIDKREEAPNLLFMCGTNSKETLCWDMNLSEQSSGFSSRKTTAIKDSIKEFVITEDEPSVLVESEECADLYITYSGSKEHVGIHKFGRHRVGPSNHDKEQHYVGLVLSRRRQNPLQDKVYAFYKEKNRDTGLNSEMWLPFVTQICVADVGGPKNNLQYSWTSQMSARLYCGDPDSRQHFSELVDVAIVHADQWQDTRVYALFRNEWSMSAVCVYTIQDIDSIFRSSPFKGNQRNRSRECVSDSTKIPLETLRMIEKTSEMAQWVRPMDNSGPLLFNHHNYTHIYVDSSQNKTNSSHPVLFLSLDNGAIHKVLQNTFVIAEYHPFNHKTHVHSIILHPSSRKLYVISTSELVQLDVANCDKYGDSCEDCVLARDPYCGWNGIRCTPVTTDTVQDVAHGDYAICKTWIEHSEIEFTFRTDAYGEEVRDMTTLPSHSKYFLQCPMSSHHARYTWRHRESSTSCSPQEQQCTLLIDSMGPEQEGTYTCLSEEKGYSRVLVQHYLQLESRAVGRSSSPLVWVCLIAVLMKRLSC